MARRWTARQRAAFERRRARTENARGRREEREAVEDALALQDMERAAAQANETLVPVDDSLQGRIFTHPENLPETDV